MGWQDIVVIVDKYSVQAPKERLRAFGDSEITSSSVTHLTHVEQGFDVVHAKSFREKERIRSASSARTLRRRSMFWFFRRCE
jgi:hypothetical protein